MAKRRHNVFSVSDRFGFFELRIFFVSGHVESEILWQNSCRRSLGGRYIHVLPSHWLVGRTWLRPTHLFNAIIKTQLYAKRRSFPNLMSYIEENLSFYFCLSLQICGQERTYKGMDVLFQTPVEVSSIALAENFSTGPEV